VADPGGAIRPPSPEFGHSIHCGQLVLIKISKIGATRYQILRIKCTKFDFRWGSAQTPLGSLQRSPRPLAVFKGPTSKGREGEAKGRRGKGRRGKGKGEEGCANWGVPA